MIDQDEVKFQDNRGSRRITGKTKMNNMINTNGLSSRYSEEKSKNIVNQANDDNCIIF